MSPGRHDDYSPRRKSKGERRVENGRHSPKLKRHRRRHSPTSDDEEGFEHSHGRKKTTSFSDEENSEEEIVGRHSPEEETFHRKKKHRKREVSDTEAGIPDRSSDDSRRRETSKRSSDYHRHSPEVSRKLPKREAERSPPRKHKHHKRRDHDDQQSRGHSRDHSHDESRNRSHNRRRSPDVRVKREVISPRRVKQEPQSPRSHDQSRDKEAPPNKAAPDFKLSGNLAADTNTYKGVVIKYNQPPEARKPREKWRLYPFKGDTDLPVVPLHRSSGYLIGRDRIVADIPVDHPSCSKQHAVLQFRLVDITKSDGTMGRKVKPYVIDLGSTNGTYLNGKRIEAERYHELREKDVIKFGFSSREYVLLHEKSHTEEVDEAFE